MVLTVAKQIADALKEAVDLYPSKETIAGYRRYCDTIASGGVPTVEDTTHATRFASRSDAICALMKKAQTLAEEARQTEEKETTMSETKTKTTYVQHLETNVKSKRGGAYDLTPCTLITGTNGAGKSALVDAISLALTGESQTEGLRKRPDMLLRLAPPGPAGADARELYARAKLSDGTEPSFHLSGKELNWKPDEITVGPRAVFLVDVARALLYGDAKALVQSIARSTTSTIFRDALENEVSKAVFPLFNEIWTEDCKLDGKLERTVGEVQLCLSATQRRLKEAKAIVKAAKTGTTFSTPLSAEEETELTQATLVLNSMRSGQSLEELRTELADLPPFNPAEYAALERRTRLFACVKEAITLLQENVPDGKAFTCPICAQKGVTRDKLRDRLEHALEVERRSEAATAHRYSTSKQHDIYAAVQGFIKRGMATSDLQTKRAELLRRKESAAAEPARRATKVVTEEEINRLELIQSVCTEAIKKATDQQLGTVERRINKALPPNYRAKILSEGGYRIELVRDEMPRDFRALSGAERVMLLTAFASATIPEGAPPVRLLVVDETWFDARPMKALMKALAKVVGTENGPTQAIICAVKVTGKAVAGWSEIKLGNASTDDEEE